MQRTRLEDRDAFITAAGSRTVLENQNAADPLVPRCRCAPADPHDDTVLL